MGVCFFFFCCLACALQHDPDIFELRGRSHNLFLSRLPLSASNESNEAGA